MLLGEDLEHEPTERRRRIGRTLDSDGCLLCRVEAFDGVDFGAVPVDRESYRESRIRNISTEPVTVTRLTLEGKELGTTTVLELTENEQTFVFTGVKEQPTPSVLRDFSAAERAELPFLVDDAADAVELLTQEGLLAAQQCYHSPR